MKTKELVEAIKNEKGSVFQNCNDCEYGTHNGEVIEKLNCLAELEDKLQNGTLIELPCKVGDTVYVLCKGDYVLVGKKTGWKYTIKKLKSTLSTFSTWEHGRTLFLTKAEAEKKLKELNGE